MNWGDRLKTKQIMSGILTNYLTNLRKDTLTTKVVTSLLLHAHVQIRSYLRTQRMHDKGYLRNDERIAKASAVAAA